MSSSKLEIEEIIDLALAEDLGKGDVTTEVLIPGDQQGTGFIVVKEEGILAGTGAANRVFQRVDPELKVECLRVDGARVKPGGKVADISFEYRNVKNTKTDKPGNILIETRFGELKHARPSCYQILGTKKVEVEARFIKIKKDTYGFEVGPYNKNYELIILSLILKAILCVK